MPLVAPTVSPLGRRAYRALAPLAVVAALSVGGGVAVYAILLEPAQARVSQALGAYEQARQVQMRLLAMRETQEALTQVWEQIPHRLEFTDIIMSVSEQARRNGVKVPGMTYAFERVEDGLAMKAAMTFQAQGDYAAIRRFIHRLETSGPHLFIESLDVSRSGGVGGRAGQVLFNLRLATYLRPEQEPAKRT